MNAFYRFLFPSKSNESMTSAILLIVRLIFGILLMSHDLPELISSLKKNTPVYGTFLDGENFYEKKLSKNGLIVMGNEGNGISKEVATLINQRLYIPNYPTNRETSESLNVAIATAVVCAEFRRQAALR